MPDYPRRLKVGLLEIDTYHTSPATTARTIGHYLEKEDFDVLVAPEYSFYHDGPQSRHEYENEVHELAKKTLGNKALLLPGTFVWYDENDKLYNTLPVIHDGKVIFTYDKKIEGPGERKIARKFNKQFSKGNGRGMLDWEKLKIGLEVCADHFRETLKGDGEKGLDLQFVVSAGVRIYDESVALKNGGYALLCDGYWPKVQVRRLVAGRTKMIPPSRVENGELYVYSLRLEEGLE